MTELSQPDIDGKVRRIMAELFEVDAEAIGEDPSRESVDRWDSLNHLQLVMALEHEFGVSFSMEEVAEITSLSRIRQALQRRGS